MNSEISEEDYSVSREIFLMANLVSRFKGTVQRDSSSELNNLRDV